jgi:hypothetical protein
MRVGGVFGTGSGTNEQPDLLASLTGAGAA